MNQPRRSEETSERRELRIEGACPTCEGAVEVRITPGNVGTWCARCRRIGRPHLAMGANGPMFVDEAAAA